MATDTDTVENKLEDAESYAEHKAMRAKDPTPSGSGSAADGTTTKKIGPVAAKKNETERGEAAGDVEAAVAAPENKDVSVKLEKKKKTASEYIEQLRASNSSERARREALEKELAAIKAAPNGRGEAETKSGADAEQSADADPDPRPSLKRFIEKLKPTELYDDAVERYTQAVYEWGERKKAAREAAARGESERQRVKAELASKVKAARAKYVDFDDVTAGDTSTGTGLILTPPMQQFVREHPAGMDVAYQLGQLPEEVRRISVLGPVAQIAALYKLAGDTGADSPPPKQRHSMAPHPPRIVGGTESSTEKKDISEASSFEEHKRLRRPSIRQA